MTTTLSDQAAALLFGALAVVVWMFAVGVKPEETACASRCFRHQSRPRLHVPCFRCQSDHPLR